MLPLIIYTLIFCWPLADSLALEPREAELLSIETVLADPQHYNLHRVRFQGRLTAITVLPNQGGCGTIDAYLFQFEDETGSIEVFDIGWCESEKSVAPLLVVNPVQVGERVAIAATIVYSVHEPGPLIRARLQWIGRLQNTFP